MMKKSIHICIKLVFVALIVTSIIGTASAAKTTVDANGRADYTSIQEAINTAKSGDTIYVRAGVYFGSLTITKKLTLQGEGEKTIVFGNFADKIISVYADGVEISGFNVTGSKSGGTGIYLKGKNNVLRDNVVMSITPVEGKRSEEYGIYLHETSNSVIERNTLNYNKYGIYLSSSIGDIIESNIATSNEYGIYLASSSENTLKNNIASFNDYGIYLNNNPYERYLKDSEVNHSSDNTIIANIAKSNIYGIYLDSASNNTLIDNIASSNNGTGEKAAYGIYLTSSFNNILINNTANSNSGGRKSVGYGAYEAYSGYGIYIVSSSNNIVMSNTANSNGGDKEGYGIYLSSSPKNALINNTVNSNFGVSINIRETIYPILGGKPVTLPSRIIEYSGYGIYLWSSPNNTIRCNTANSNNGAKEGYGIYLSRSNNSNIAGNTASSNSDYGIYLSNSADNTLWNNNLSLNKYSIYLSSSSDDNTITYNNISDLGIDSSNNNLICRNNLFGKTSDYYGINAWDDGREGNYWSDYTGEDANNDGIGDTPYTNINTNYPLTKDSFPLMKPVKKPTDITTRRIIAEIKSKVMPSPVPMQIPEEQTPSPISIPLTPGPSAPFTSPSQRNWTLILTLIGVICSVIIVSFGTGVGKEIINRIINRTKNAKTSHHVSIKRTIWDPTNNKPITTSKEDKEFPVIRKTIERLEKGSALKHYWFVLCIANHANKGISAFSVTFEAKETLKILSACVCGRKRSKQ
jgi:parallel beta-helix repeat protein